MSWPRLTQPATRIRLNQREASSPAIAPPRQPSIRRHRHDGVQDPRTIVDATATLILRGTGTVTSERTAPVGLAMRRQSRATCAARPARKAGCTPIRRNARGRHARTATGSDRGECRGRPRSVSIPLIGTYLRFHFLSPRRTRQPRHGATLFGRAVSNRRDGGLLSCPDSHQPEHRPRPGFLRRP